MATAADQTAAASSARKKPVGIFSLHEENDVFARTDRQYTNGTRFVWISPPVGQGSGRMRLPRWLDSLSRAVPPFQPEGSDRLISICLGQNIYTPNDIDHKELIVDDRPYAGFLYAGVGFHAKNATSMDSIEFLAGVVGPVSLACEFQRLLHRTFGWTRPKGWDNQLKNEPVLGVVFDHKWKLRRPSPDSRWNWDAIAHSGAGLSNAWTGATAGIEFRFGKNLPADFGTSTIKLGSDGASLFEERDTRRSGPPPIDIHFFAALEGRAVLRDVFLDGNTFTGSHRLDKRLLSIDLAVGLAVRLRRFKFSFSLVEQTKRFSLQKHSHIFGSLVLTLMPDDEAYRPFIL